jgi:hypothetical protein
MIGLTGGIEKGGLNVLRLEKGVVAQNLLVGGASGEKLEQIHDAKTGAPDAGAPATFARFNSDAFERLHGAMLLLRVGFCQQRFQVTHSVDDFLFHETRAGRRNREWPDYWISRRMPPAARQCFRVDAG